MSPDFVTRPRIQIFHAGDDPADRAFAEQIASMASGFADPVFMDTDEFDRQDDTGDYRPEGFRGTPVYVLSPGLLDKDWNRAKLVGSIPLLGKAGWQGFFICRGINVHGLLRQYPDLTDLHDKVMIGNEDDLPEMVDELREYLPLKEGLQRRSRFGALVMALCLPLLVLGYPMYLLSYVGVPAAILLMINLLAEAGMSAVWEVRLACLCLYAAGFLLNTLPAMDLWPWMGRRWILPAGASDIDLTRNSSPASAQLWTQMLCLEAPQPGRASAECTEKDLRLIVRGWLGAVRRSAALRAWLMLLLIVPSLVALSFRTEAMPTIALLALLVGFIAPILYYRATRTVHRNLYELIGLSRKEMARSDEALGMTSAPRGLPTPVGWRMGAAVAAQSLSSWRVRRRWFRQRDRVFISYAWADQEQISMAEPIASCLDRMGCNCFLDRRGIQGRFSAWRGRVARELLECTHLIAIIGPRAAKGGVMGREIQTVLHRWQTELSPSVICVVHPELSEQVLGEEADLPFAFRLLLRWCPQLDYDQAIEPETLAYLIRQRRRQGLLQDWLSVIEPSGRIRRMLRGMEASRRGGRSLRER